MKFRSYSLALVAGSLIASLAFAQTSTPAAAAKQAVTETKIMDTKSKEQTMAVKTTETKPSDTKQVAQTGATKTKKHRNAAKQTTQSQNTSTKEQPKVAKAGANTSAIASKTAN